MGQGGLSKKANKKYRKIAHAWEYREGSTSKEQIKCVCMNARSIINKKDELNITRQVTRATHVRTRVCPRVEFILKIIIILLIIFLGFIKSKPC